MNRLFLYSLRMPVDLVVASIELLLRTFQDFQREYRQATEGALTTPPPALPAPTRDPLLPLQSSPSATVVIDPATPSPPHEHEPHEHAEAMSHSDQLDNKKVKNITYWITFRKKDFVTTLQESRDETVDYATTEGSYGGLKIAQFMLDMQESGIEYPSDWKNDPDSGYVVIPRDKDSGRRLYSIPKRDHQFIRFNYKINWVEDQPSSEYDRERVEVLRDIRDALR